MARRRQRKKNARNRGGPHGDGFGDQGDLLADSEADDEGEAVVESGSPSGDHAGEEQEPVPDVDTDTEPAEPSQERAVPPVDPVESSDGEPAPPVDDDVPAAEEATPPSATVSPVQARELEAASQLASDGQVERALERVHRIVEADPESVPLLVAVVDVLGHLTRFDDAEPYLKRAQRLAPDEVEVRAAAGILAFRRGLYPQAEAEFRVVCQRNPDHPAAHYYRGEALNRLGRVDEALEVLLHAIELLPDDARPFHTLGRLYDRKSQPDEAARMYRRARELNQP